MKLHYSTEGAANSRYRKIKSVINALKLEVVEASYETNADLSKLSVFNTLPLLETSEGTFFSSNTIVRYLASISGNKLYGGQNLHNRALIDQWLDITTCDLEAAVAAVAIAKDGREVDTSKLLEDLHKFLTFVEKHLNGRKFLVGDEPSIADFSLATSVSVVLTAFGEEERTHYPHLTAWYLSLAATDVVVGSKDLPKEAHKAFKPKKDKKQEAKKQPVKVEEKKEEPKKVEEEVTLFDDDEVASAPKPKPVVKPEVKKEKKKVVAKSIVVFDVKVYELEQDLDKLADRIRSEVTMDGLVWNTQQKKIPIAYGMSALQLGCVIEDDKILTDDIFEKILAWEEEVQSVDTVSFQKL